MITGNSTIAGQLLDEGRWRELYQGMNQGFIYARVLRDDAGRIEDWRYVDVNRAWGDLVGIDPEEARGKTVRELIPGIENEWVVELARVIESHEPARFTRQVGALDRWYDGVAQWVGDDDFTVIFTEVTDRILAQRKRDALLALGDMLRDERDIGAMRSKATRIIGEALGAQRVAFGDVEAPLGTVEFPGGYALAGNSDLLGRYRFDDYGTYMDRFLDGETVVLHDVKNDPRTSGDLEGWHSLGTRSAVNLPISESGQVVGILVVQFSEPHDWTQDELAFLKSAGDRLEIAISRRRAQDRQDVLNQEISHRLKNTLAMVQAVAMQTFRGKVPADAMESYTRRLRALGAAQDALIKGRTDAGGLKEVIGGVLANLSVGDRCELAGPEVAMGARAALAASLLTHELATNAIKYGALSVAGGRIAITWRLEGLPDDRTLVLDWTESGGPEASEPDHRGFGSRLIGMGLIGTGGSDLRYTDTGFHGEFRASLQQVEQA